MATKHSKATHVNIETLRSQAEQVSGAIVAALEQCRNSPFSETTDQPLEALLEKAGYVSDKMLKQLGSVPIWGSIEGWMEAEEPNEAPPAEQAPATH